MLPGKEGLAVPAAVITGTQAATGEVYAMAVSVESAAYSEERKTEKRELACGRCGYGIVVASEPPACPMCRSTAWELARRELASLRVVS